MRKEEEEGDSAALQDTLCGACQSVGGVARLDCGHRICSSCSDPDQTRTKGDLCPVCDVFEKQKLILRRTFEAEAADGFSDLHISFREDFHSIHQELRLSDIFKRQVPGARIQSSSQKPRLVLTLGVAGVGKTFSVLKFSLDWAQGSENQDLDLVLPLSFRELNLTRGGRYSLLQLIHVFHPSLQSLSPHTLLHSKVLLVLDGLDESRLPLDFSCEVISEVTQGSEVGALLVNLIRGSLLPDALVWITSRPAAADQIPSEYVQRLTEVRGFLTDRQKEQFFRTRFSDAEQFGTVLSHIRSSRCLHTMCQIPVFCWITATVLDHMMRRAQSGPLPQTLTELYAHFLLVQTQRKKKDGAESSAPELSADRDLLLKLGRLAFEHLQNRNIMFYEEDLEEVGLDLSQASVYYGLCSEIFKLKSVIFHKSTYCFKPRSLQEFLAAVYIHHCLHNNISEGLLTLLGPKGFEESDRSLHKVLRETLKKSPSDLDLFVRFLHGLSLESGALEPLLGPNKTDKKNVQRVVDKVKMMTMRGASPDKRVSALQCLSEMKDGSLQQKVLDLLKSEKSLSEIQCSALASMLQMSEPVLEELDLNKFCVSFEGKLRMIPAVSNCTKARFSFCQESKTYCEVLASALKSDQSPLKELDLNDSETLGDSGVEVLCEGLQSPHCRLETLRLFNCRISEKGCFLLVKALMSNPDHLRTLDLGQNSISNTGVSSLCVFLKSPRCQIHTLRLNWCRLSEEDYSALASVLESGSSLRELDLSTNEVRESDVTTLSRGLKSPGCRLEVLRLQRCRLSQSSCSVLASALRSNPGSALRELDLLHNLLDTVPELTQLLQDPKSSLQTLRTGSWKRTSSRPISGVQIGNRRRYEREMKEEEMKKEADMKKEAEMKKMEAEMKKMEAMTKEEMSGGDAGGGDEEGGAGTSGGAEGVQSSRPVPGVEPLDLKDFTPEISTESRSISFRFRCPGSGAFRCSSTGLVFVVTKEAELQYRTVQWDEALLESSGRTPAGPLYNIECPERAVCELHLQHCEPEHVAQFECRLSVAHISDCGVSFIEPLRITKSHVVIQVSGLSVFGLVWDWFYQKIKSVWGQVLLFLAAQNHKTKRRRLNVLLLPRNVSLDEVRPKQPNMRNVQVPAFCNFTINKNYSVQCPEAAKVQPEKFTFFLDYGPNYHPMFEIRLTAETELIKLTIRDENQAQVWQHEVDLTDVISEELRAADASDSSSFLQTESDASLKTWLSSVRPDFIQRVSESVLDQVLDRLLASGVLNAAERESAGVKERRDRAALLLDSVLRKGARASRLFLKNLSDLDPCLTRDLQDLQHLQHLQHLPHLQHLQHIQHLQHLQHIQHLQHQTTQP